MSSFTFGLIHTNAFSFENVCFLLRSRLSSKLKRPMKTVSNVETFENAPFLVRTGENGDVKSVTCHRFQSKLEHLSKMAVGLVMLTHAQSQVPVVFLVFERFSVRDREYKNASVDKNMLLRFRRDENGYFKKRINVDGASEFY